jgi:hypothetical protein
LGIAATLLGGVGSLMLVLAFSLPHAQPDTRGLIGALGVIADLLGLCVATVSFWQPNRRRVFSWSGLILSGWPCVCPVLALIFVAIAGRGNDRVWVRGHWRRR